MNARIIGISSKNSLDCFFAKTKNITEYKKLVDIGDLLKSRIKRITKISSNIGMTVVKNRIIVALRALYKNDVIDNCINTNCNLFAFNNSVLDLTTYTLRDIEAVDYIAATSGYSYNNNVSVT